jgi:hypothetical protein
MGGSQPNTSNYIPQPSNAIPEALLGMQATLGQNALANQNQLLELTSALPQQAYTPDIYSPVGQLAQANKVAAVNAYNSQKLEQQANPAAASAREAINNAAAQNVNPSYWQNQMNKYGKQTGLIQ